MNLATMVERSEFAAAVEAKYGTRVPLLAASRIATEHGTCLVWLQRDEHLFIGSNSVDTLSFVMALGY